MRNPRRWRTVSLAFVASGLVSCALPFVLPEAMAGDNVRTALFTYGLVATIFGSVSAIMCHVALRAAKALARGEDVIARWHLDAATWRKFVERNRTLAAPDGLLNELSIPDAIPEGGIDVIVGRKAIQVGESIHVLPEVQHAELIQDDPDYIALKLLYPGGGGGASGVPQGPTRIALRFPVAPKSWHDARATIAYFMGFTPRTPDFFHGKGDGKDAEDLNTCIHCGFETYRFLSECPQCGGSMLTRRWVRRAGGILIPLGLFITGAIGAVCYYMVPMLLHPGKEYDHTRFSGTAVEALVVLAIFAAVLAFGITALAYGIYQLKTGKRDRRVMRAMLVICGFLIASAYAIAYFG